MMSPLGSKRAKVSPYFKVRPGRSCNDLAAGMENCGDRPFADVAEENTSVFMISRLPLARPREHWLGIGDRQATLRKGGLGPTRPMPGQSEARPFARPAGRESRVDGQSGQLLRSGDRYGLMSHRTRSESSHSGGSRGAASWELFFSCVLKRRSAAGPQQKESFSRRRDSERPLPRS